jgi:hypothetical protein
MTEDVVPDDEREVPLEEEDDRRDHEDFDWPDEAAR